jgi:hypothetical protein
MSLANQFQYAPENYIYFESYLCGCHQKSGRDEDQWMNGWRDFRIQLQREEWKDSGCIKENIS